MLERLGVWWLVALLILVGTLRIAATWNVFSYTFDEPAHLACGMEWLDRGTYNYEDLHPPLARLAAALLPYLDGARSRGLPDKWEEGRALLGNAPTSRNLILARAGMLPFFWIACLSVFWLGRMSFGDRIAIIALALFSLLPPILAHAGLATTDMALTAGMSWALAALLFWVRGPSAFRAALLGMGIACAVSSKLSSLPFLPAAAAGLLLPMAIAHPGRARHFLLRLKHLAHLALACAVAALLVWALYRFSWGHVRGTVPMRPAPEFWGGIKSVRWHNRNGAVSWLFGELNTRGFIWFYPVCLALKTPLPWLLMVVAGVAAGWKNARMWSAFGASLAIFLVALIFGHINLGIRHILPVYVGLSLVAALGLNALLKRRATAVAGAALALWLAIATTRAHPDYLPYFNELAGNQPERILIDSDIDWGQDVLRLEKRLHDAHATRVAFLKFVSDPRGVEIEPFPLDAPQPGWNAAHITPLTIMAAQAGERQSHGPFWFERIPGEHVGKGILLWWFEPPTPQSSLQPH